MKAGMWYLVLVSLFCLSSSAVFDTNWKPNFVNGHTDKMRANPPPSMPDPRVILGGLAAQRDQWPEDGDSTRAPYLRQTRDHQDLLVHFTKVMVMSERFRQKSTRSHLTRYMGSALEAFCVVTYVNNYDNWYEEATRTPVQNPLGALLTAGMTRRHMGWSDLGRAMYRRVGETLRGQRETSRLGSEFDKALKLRFRNGVVLQNLLRVAEADFNDLDQPDTDEDSDAD
jgi:hypothetical protein